MRVAMLIPGEPRFCREFDSFLDNLRGYTSIDWFVWLWQSSQSEVDRGVDVVAPSWRSLNHAAAHARLVKLLPQGHTLASLTIADRSHFPPPQVHNKAGETNVARMWGMYNSLDQCDLARRSHEQTVAQPYDLVIRTRPDIGLTAPLDLMSYRHFLDQNPSTVITPHNEVHGYGHRTNDMMAMGLGQAMSVYCNLAQHIVHYHQLGLIYHPETMLAFHMQARGLTNHNTDTFEVSLRKLGSVVDGAYRSDYGRWA